ncbi:MAG TPA: DNRLRE domain-containing protein [Candidatus Goldiibacteriota bacterium]|nr:DNRLRE domain-containing protein [Candidatus Goldiibacteriota bacterium]
MKNLAVFLVLLFFAVSCAGPAGETGPAGIDGKPGFVTVFQYEISPDAYYDGVFDTFITSTAPYSNAGNASSSYCGNFGGQKYRVLTRFDTTDIPEGASVIRAELELSSEIYSYNAGATITAYAVTKTWAESEASWISRTASEVWTSPGGDYGAALAEPGFLADNNSKVKLVLDKSVVQGWISNPSQNYGVLIRAANETMDTLTTIVHSDNPTFPSMAQKLTVYYTLP